MNPFERALFGEDAEIPLHEASSFFLGMRRPLQKTAGWQDPPDETGALEGQFEVPIENAVSLMGKCAMGALRLMNAGLIYSSSVRGPLAKETKCVLDDAVWDHKDFFEYLVSRMTVLLGAPHIPDTDMPPSSTDPVSIVQRMIRAEQECIQCCQELLAVCGKNPMCAKLKEHLSRCQGHVDRLWRLLPSGPLAQQPADPMGMAEHEAMETPEEEALESPEFQAAEEAAGVEEHKMASVRRIAASMAKQAMLELKGAGHRKTASSAVVRWVKTADEMTGSLDQAEAPMASPTDNQELSPVNYLQAEAIGQQLQDRREADFYKQKAMAAEQQAQQAQADAQMQVQQVQQQAAQAIQDAQNAEQKVKSALDAAIKAKDDALKQTETAARMRIAQQDLRMKLIELAAADPDQQAAMDLAQTTGQANALGQPIGTVPPAGAMAPDAGLNAGPPGGGAMPQGAAAAPDPQTAPGAAPPAGGADMNANAGPPPGPDPSMAQGLPQMKTSEARFIEAILGMSKVSSPKDDSVRRIAPGLIGAGAGAIIGGVDQAYRTHKGVSEGVEPLQTRIADIESKQDGSYAQAASLAKAKSQLAQRELAVAHPRDVIARKALGGAVKGGVLGFSIGNNGRQLFDLLKK